jgi:hypothetical protein
MEWSRSRDSGSREIVVLFLFALAIAGQLHAFSRLISIGDEVALFEGPPPAKVIGEQGAAKLSSLSRGTLERRRHLGMPPPFIRAGSRVFPIGPLRVWLSQGDRPLRVARARRKS